MGYYTRGVYIHQDRLVAQNAKRLITKITTGCISTEFTSKRHGGERGVPLKLIIDTSTLGLQPQRLDIAYCQIKVFKSKGADRKHKTDRERFDRTHETSKYLFQPAYDCTLFIELDSEHVEEAESDPRLEALPSYSSNSPQGRDFALSGRSPEGAGGYPYEPSPLRSDSEASALSPPEYIPPAESDAKDSPPSKDEPSGDDGSDEMSTWLLKNRFDKHRKAFRGYSWSDLALLSKTDLIHVCGTMDGIR